VQDKQPSRKSGRGGGKSSGWSSILGHQMKNSNRKSDHLDEKASMFFSPAPPLASIDFFGIYRQKVWDEVQRNGEMGPFWFSSCRCNLIVGQLPELAS